MPLNLPRRSSSSSRGSSSANDFIPPLRYSATTGLWTTWDEVAREMVEVAAGFTAIIDLEHVKTGWLRFARGEKPDLVWDLGGNIGQRPSKDHRRGFAVNLFSPEIYGLRELCSNTTGLVAALVALYDQYEAAPERQRGLLPLIQCGEPTPVETSNGQVWDPVFVIVDWIPRPAELPVPPPVTVGPHTTALIVDQELDDEIPDFGHPAGHPGKPSARGMR